MKNIAPLPIRIVSMLIDTAIGLLPFLISILMIASVTKIEDLFGIAVWALTAFFGMSLIAPVILTVAPITMLGGTLGKYATGLEIVTSDGKWLDCKKALWRNYMGYIVSSLLLWVGFFWAFRDKNKQTWHDMMAGTFVIQKRQWTAIGIGVLVVVIVINVLLVRTIAQQFRNNVFVYTQLFREIERIEKERDEMRKLKRDQLFQDQKNSPAKEAFDQAL